MSMSDEEYFEFDCGYFPDKVAQEIIDGIPDAENSLLILKECRPDLLTENDNTNPQEIIYAEYLKMGFRRSDCYFYCAECPKCKKCLDIRINVKDFLPSKSQRKACRKNQDVQIRLVEHPQDFVTEEKIQLFKEYDRRHNPEKNESYEEAKESLYRLNGVSRMDDQFIKVYQGTMNIDFLLNGKVIGVSVVDRAKNALSSNYFYYDISQEVMKRSIGVFSVLAEIDACKGLLFDGQLKSELYYLGYYIEDCKKMNYKSNYNPHELLIDGEWIRQ